MYLGHKKRKWRKKIPRRVPRERQEKRMRLSLTVALISFEFILISQKATAVALCLVTNLVSLFSLIVTCLNSPSNEYYRKVPVSYPRVQQRNLGEC